MQADDLDMKMPGLNVIQRQGENQMNQSTKDEIKRHFSRSERQNQGDGRENREQS
jgi:hypothetical protein